MAIRVERYVDGIGLVEVSERPETPEELEAAQLRPLLGKLETDQALNTTELQALVKVLSRKMGLVGG